jgi:hypothetical protein
MPRRVLALVPRRVKAPAPRLVDNHYRVSLTKEVRRTLGVGPGDYVTFQVADDGTVYLRKILLTVAMPGQAGPARLVAPAANQVSAHAGAPPGPGQPASAGPAQP